MTKVKRTKRSRFEGVNLTSLNTDAAKVTGQNLTISNVDNTEKKHIEKRKKADEKPATQRLKSIYFGISYSGGTLIKENKKDTLNNFEIVSKLEDIKNQLIKIKQHL